MTEPDIAPPEELTRLQKLQDHRKGIKNSITSRENKAYQAAKAYQAVLTLAAGVHNDFELRDHVQAYQAYSKARLISEVTGLLKSVAELEKHNALIAAEEANGS